MYPSQTVLTAQTALNKAIVQVAKSYASRLDQQSAEHVQATLDMLSHGNRCSRLMLILATKLQRVAPEDEFEPDAMAFGAFYHDIGKCCVPVKLLLAPRRLSTQEYEIVKAHTNYGREIAEVAVSLLPRPHQGLTCLHAMAACHHERWDGTGYPNRLIGDAIPFPARVMAILDTYDAVRSSRAYKAGLSHSLACEEIEAGMDRAYDPDIARCFLSSTRFFVHLLPELASRPF